MDMKNVLFIGAGDTLEGITHYRSYIPSKELGAMLVVQDHKGTVHFHERCSNDDPSIIIQQMPVHKFHFEQMRKAKLDGKVVLANVDDYLPSIPKQGKRGAHGHGEVFDSEVQRIHRRSLELADGILCSTEWLAQKYSSVNRTYLCRNGLDLRRYQVDNVIRDVKEAIIGWAGGTGHRLAIQKLIPVLRQQVDQQRKVAFFGDDHRDSFLHSLNPLEVLALKDKIFHVPWVNDYYMYVRDLVAMDIAICPAEDNDFYRAKSQLKFYEMAALGIPSICAPMYTEVKHGQTGFIANNLEEWNHYLDLLCTDEEYRLDIGKQAKEWAWNNVGINHRIHEWEHVLNVIADKHNVGEVECNKDPVYSATTVSPQLSFGMSPGKLVSTARTPNVKLIT